MKAFVLSRCMPGGARSLEPRMVGCYRGHMTLVLRCGAVLEMADVATAQTARRNQPIPGVEQTLTAWPLDLVPAPWTALLVEVRGATS
jgi:hypothetical protein